MTTCTFKVVIEPDEDRWHASCPALVGRGAATWGHTREEALANIEEVLKMVVASMIEHGKPIQPSEAVQVSLRSLWSPSPFEAWRSTAGPAGPSRTCAGSRS